ncbi:uncharacterized protein LOC128173505 isoform X1 [Crassostrea angulata]|uniref:uncharacterized protein LOC128173505 isoform X1 n=1 Tax=Magallana angulata TaxID=2784310 RepID=UPI00148AA226|nr:uncharacterized protein LOC105324075 isoform X1 [Crassostrea gigas]XP_034320402.1 uncharacterized protein LOC105324075 isoform X1 [Crassostrea gigas]XP_034320403.1 uncharacterized protein LOC105324075 isoform X1 [Crassostrea gigas]XP_034320404.1 uncharacterized protein LOC105324075 isoform X1 [Crassostrea gigas]XP_034320405.1 uncharacterized protein LOC105324075 isoform X1 [Crassostrea gigas]XP_034320406.1 uncharacterized protein LOC105324075 isoform X1 [Crassostrea gigas]XP_052695164.1 un
MEKQDSLTLRESSEHFEGESTPNSFRSSRNTMEKREVLTHRENTEYFERESTPDSFRARCNITKKQDILTLREKKYLYVPELFEVQTNSIVQEEGNLAAEKSTCDSLHSNKGSQACQSGIMDFVENSNLSTLSEEVSYHCFPSLSSYDESSQLDRVSVGVTCTQS